MIPKNPTEHHWSLKTYLAERGAQIDKALDSYLPNAELLPTSLHKGMRYSTFAGGKRIRPVLCIAACEAVGGDVLQALPAACALEMIHTYSLIHDDLPAMDDDDFRRGEPTNHKVFGEAGAILAGDALCTEAFALLTAGSYPGGTAAALVQLIARAAGSQGMVGGQVADMEAEGQPIELPMLEYIHTHKTGALLLASIQAGAIVADASPTQYKALTRYGEAAGLAFQIADDILDITADPEQLGKDIGSDQQRHKATFPALMGLEASRERAMELKDLALDALDPLGEAAHPLRAIAAYIVERTH